MPEACRNVIPNFLVDVRSEDGDVLHNVGPYMFRYKTFILSGENGVGIFVIFGIYNHFPKTLIFCDIPTEPLTK